MKNRSLPFDCAIAAKTVGISLRHGGSLQEPGTVYVRCDERDCQYVDINEPPCPLRVDMFTDGTDDRVGRHLAENAGTRFCYACLTEILSVTHQQVRRASWRLKEVPSFAIKPSRCAACRRRRVTIGITAEGVQAVIALMERLKSAAPVTVDAKPPSTPGKALEHYLRTHPGFGFCTHCLAHELAETPPTIRGAMWHLEPQPDYDIRSGQCVSCLLTKQVIRYDDAADPLDAPRRVIGLLLKTPGSARCASCIAFETDLGLADVRRIVGVLETLEGFTRSDAPCDVCGRWQPVIAIDDGESEAASHAAGDVAEAMSGRVRHRGFRIDLLSFRNGEGWRPFALVKTAAGALVPDAPALLFDVRTTKSDADEVAAVQARAWIDKRSP
jgi:hypothetical protein